MPKPTVKITTSDGRNVDLDASKFANEYKYYVADNPGATVLMYDSHGKTTQVALGDAVDKFRSGYTYTAPKKANAPTTSKGESKTAVKQPEKPKDETISEKASNAVQGRFGTQKESTQTAQPQQTATAQQPTFTPQTTIPQGWGWGYGSGTNPQTVLNSDGTLRMPTPPEVGTRTRAAVQKTQEDFDREAKINKLTTQLTHGEISKETYSKRLKELKSQEPKGKEYTYTGPKSGKVITTNKGVPTIIDDPTDLRNAYHDIQSDIAGSEVTRKGAADDVAELFRQESSKAGTQLGRNMQGASMNQVAGNLYQYNQAVSPERLGQLVQDEGFVNNKLVPSVMKVVFKYDGKGNITGYQDDITNKAKSLGISEEEFVQKSVFPHIVSGAIDDIMANEDERNKVRGTGDYLLAKLNASFLGTVISLGTKTRKQRQSQAQALEEYEEKQKKEGGWANFGERALGESANFVGDLPLFQAGGFLGKGVSWGAGKLFGALGERFAGNAFGRFMLGTADYALQGAEKTAGSKMATSLAERTLAANSSVLNKALQRYVASAPSSFVNLGFYGGSKAATQELSIGNNPSLATVGKAFLTNGWNMAKTGAVLPIGSSLVGSFSSKYASSALERSLLAGVGFGAEGGTFMTVDYLKDPDKYNATDSFFDTFSMLLGMRLGGKLTGGKWGGDKSSSDTGSIFNPKNWKAKWANFTRNTGNALSWKLTKEQLQELQDAYPDKPLEQIVDFDFDKRIKRYESGYLKGAPMRDKDGQVIYEWIDKDGNVIAEEDQDPNRQALVKFGQEIAGNKNISWETKQKLFAGMFDTFETNRPIYDHHEVEGKNLVKFYAKDGQLISTRIFTDKDELDALVYNEKVRKLTDETVAKYAEMNLTIPDSFKVKVNTNKGQAEVTPEEYLSLLGIDAERVNYLLMRDPNKLSADDIKTLRLYSGALDEIYDQLHDGELHPEHSAAEGEKIADDANIVETPQPDVVKQLEDDLNQKFELSNKAEEEADKIVRAKDLHFDGQFWFEDDVMRWLNGGEITEDEAKILLGYCSADANYLNAHKKYTAFVERTGEKIDEYLDKVWYDQRFDGKRGDGLIQGFNDRVTVQDNSGKIFYLKDGTRNDDGTVSSESGMVLVYDPETGGIDYKKPEELKIVSVENKDDVLNPMRQQMQEEITALNGFGQNERPEAVPQGTGQPKAKEAPKVEPEGEVAEQPRTEQPVEKPKPEPQQGNASQNETQKEPKDGDVVVNNVKRDDRYGYTMLELTQYAERKSGGIGKVALGGIKITADDLVHSDDEDSWENKLDGTENLVISKIYLTDDGRIIGALTVDGVDYSNVLLNPDGPTKLGEARNEGWVPPRQKTRAEFFAEKKSRAKMEVRNEPSSEVGKKFAEATKIEGRSRTRTLADGTKIKGRYFIVPAESVTPSHDALNGYKKSEGFPTTEDGKTINDRDYEKDVNAQQNTDAIAQHFDGQAVDNIPTVSDEGIVYDGNGRTMAGQKAAQMGTDAEYLEALYENAEGFGVTEEQIRNSGIEHPRVIFVPDERLPYDTKTFARFNKNDKKTQSNVEQAVKQSKTLTKADVAGIIDTVETYGTMDGLFKSVKGVNDVLKILQEKGIIGANEIAELKDGDLLSAKGEEFVENILLGALFKEDAIRMLGVEKGLKRKVLGGMRSIMETMKLGEQSLAPRIDEAIKLVYEAKRGGFNVAGLLQQTSMFGESAADRYSYTAKALAQALDGKVSDFRDLIDAYNNHAKSYATGEEEMFEEKPTMEQLESEVFKNEKLNNIDNEKESTGANNARPANVQGTARPEQKEGTGTGKEGNGAEPGVKGEKPEGEPSGTEPQETPEERFEKNLTSAMEYLETSKANDPVLALVRKFGYTRDYADRLWREMLARYEKEKNQPAEQAGTEQGPSGKAEGTEQDSETEGYEALKKDLADFNPKAEAGFEFVYQELERLMKLAKAEKDEENIAYLKGQRRALDEKLDAWKKEHQAEEESPKSETPKEEDYKTRLNKVKVTDEDITNILGGDEMLPAVKKALEKVKNGEKLGQIEEGLVKAVLMAKEEGANDEALPQETEHKSTEPKAKTKPSVKTEGTEPTAEDATRAQLKNDVSDAAQEAKDALLAFFKPKKGNNTYAMLVPVNPEQVKAFPRVVSAVGKLGYRVIKLGAYDFKTWCDRIKDELGTFFKEQLGWNDENIDDFTKEMWDLEFKLGDEVHTIKDWAETEKKNLSGDSAKFAEKEGNRDSFKNAVSSKLKKAIINPDERIKSIRELRELAKEHGLEGAKDTDLQEIVESAIVDMAREFASNKDISEKDRFDQIRRLYELQPSLNQRDTDRIMLQQYSTPAPMAYCLDMFVDPDGTAKSGLEPSAGNGMLTIRLDKGIMHVNDIDEMRLSNLQKQGFKVVTNQDGTKPFGKKKYKVVVTNPPFGSTAPKEYDGFTISGLEHQMAINALESMEDDGRAAIIVGGNMEYQPNGAIKGARDKAFYNYLYQHYNVVDVINLDGKKLYSRQGTGYDVRMILIDGRKPYDGTVFAPVEKKARAEKVSDYDELFNRVNDDILRIKDKSADIRNAESGESNRADDRADVAKPSKEGVRNVRTTGSSREPKLSTEGGHELPKPVGGRSADSATEVGEGGNATTEGNGRLGGQPVADNGRRSESSETSGRTDGEGRRGEQGVSQRGDNAQSDVRTDDKSNGVGQRGTDAPQRNDEPEQRKLGAEKVPYRKKSANPFSLNSLMPAEQADQVEKVLNEIGDVDALVTKELGYSSVEEMHKGLAAEQVDSVAMAIHQMNQGNAFIIGDQTGIGKGRQAAALIRYGVKKGGCPVFVTVKKGLFSDMYRDLCDIGSPELRPFIWAADDKDHSANVTDADGNVVYKLPSAKEQERVVEYINKNGKLPPEYDYVLTTYDGFKSGNMEYENGNKKPRKFGKGKNPNSSVYLNGQKKRDAFEALASNSYVIMDESHNAGGEGSNVSGYLQYITTKSKGTTFLSATFAKRPGNMPIYSLRTAISKANVKIDELIAAVKKGGATFQEVMSKALTEAGQMIRRERDMTGVTIDWKGIEDEEVIQKQREQYDTIIGLFNSIIDFQKKYVDPIVDQLNDEAADMQSEVDHTPGTRDMGINNTPFASRTYNMVQQVLLSLKAEETARRAIEHMKQGRKAVIAVANTNEGAAGEASVDGEDMDMPDLSVNLKKGLQGVLRITNKNATGDKQNTTIPLSRLGAEGQKRYGEIMTEIENASSGLSLSPIDVIKNELKKAGYKVGELTGRTSEFVYNEDGTVRRVKRTDTDKKKVAAQFNNGDLDALILNRSAGTGISLHASSKFKDQRQRIMIVAQAQGDVNDEVQIRGRIDRTGQILRGMYEYVVSNIPSEQRLLMMLKSKLRSLDANTTSSQKSKFNEMQVQDVMNKYGDAILIQYLAEHPDTYAKLADPLKWGDNVYSVDADTLVKSAVKAEGDGGTASKILGRMALLKVKEQEAMLDDISELYSAEINRLNDMGENDLEITEMPLRAKTLNKKIWENGSEPDSGNPFADNTYIETVDMDVLKKPMKATEVKASQERFLDGKTYEEYKAEKKGEIEAWEKEKSEQIRTEYEERAKRNADKEREKVLKQALKNKEKNKMTDEECEKLADAQYKETYDSVIDKMNVQLKNVELQRKTLENALDQFDTDHAVVLPKDIYDMSNIGFGRYYGKVIDIKFSKNFSTSSSTITFATLDGRRKITVPLSGMVRGKGEGKSDLFKWIAVNTQHTRSGVMGENAAKELKVLEMNNDNWDRLTSTPARKKGYIITGNLLQALVSTSKQMLGGKLISYTTDTGEVRQGLLMPDNFDPKSIVGGKPISDAFDLLKRGDTVISADGSIEIRSAYGWTNRGYGHYYELYVPKSTKQGGKYFQDNDILKLTNDGEFSTHRGKMMAKVSDDDIEKVLSVLSKKHGIQVQTDAEGNINNIPEAPEGEYRDGDEEISEEQKSGGKNDLTPAFKNNRGTKIARIATQLKGGRLLRPGHLKIGKSMMGKLYIHRDYASQELPEDFIKEGEKYLPEGFTYNTICYDPKNPDVIRFDECPNFDTAKNPRVGRQFGVNVKTGEPIYRGKDGIRNEQQIFHDKWQWVDNDYKGFDVVDSYDWSKRYNSQIEGTPNGRTNKWEEQLENAGLKSKDEEIQYRTSEELDKEYPGWQNQTNPHGSNEGGHSTQISSTRKTYQKVGKWMLENGMKDATVLDASSGLGFGTLDMRDMGLDVEDVEPFAGKGRQEPPTYTSYDDIDKQYDLVVSNAVLNVIPDDWRADVLKSMADKVKVGGKMFINCLNNVSVSENTKILGRRANGKPNEVLTMWDKDHYRSYQHIYSAKELADYVKEQLGDGWKVETAKKAGIDSSDAIVVTRETDDVVQYRSVPDEVLKGASQGREVKVAPKAITDHAEKIAKEYSKAGGEVHVASSEDDLNAEEKRALARKPKAKGFHNRKTGKITIFAWNNHCKADVEQTVFHEKVGHDGLRGLFGEQGYRKFMGKLWYGADKDMRQWVTSRMSRNGQDLYKAIDEYLATKTEDMATPATFWGKVRKLVNEGLRKMGFKGTITQENIREAIWLSAHRLREGNIEDNIRYKDFMHKMKMNPVKEKISEDKNFFEEPEGKTSGTETEPSADAEGTESNGEYRTATPSGLSARILYRDGLSHKWYIQREAHQDNMLSARMAMNAILKADGGKLENNEDFLNAENQMSSKNMDEQRAFVHDYMEPFDDVLSRCIPKMEGNGVKERYNNLERYVYALSGLERNRIFAVEKTGKKLHASLEKKILNLSDAKQKAEDQYNLTGLQVDKDALDDVTLKLQKAQQAMQDLEDMTSGFDAERAKLNADLKSGKIDLRDYFNKMDWYIRTGVPNFDAGKNDMSGLRATDMFGDGDEYDDAQLIEDVMDTESMLGKDDVDALWKSINGITNFSLDKEYNSQCSSKAAHDHAQSMMNWYAPLRGFSEDTAEDTWGYMNSETHMSGKVLMTAKGRSSAADHPIATAIAMANRAITRGNRNLMLNYFRRFVENHPSDLITELGETWFAQNPRTGEWEAQYPDITPEMDGDDVANEIDAFNLQMEQAQMNGMPVMKQSQLKADIPLKFEIKNDKSQHFINVMVGGKRHTYVVNGNPRMAQALNGMLNDSWGKGAGFQSVLKAPTNFMSKMATSYSLTFMARNAVRDWEFASAYLTATEGAKYAALFEKNYFGTIGMRNVANLGAGALLPGESVNETEIGKKYNAVRDKVLADSMMMLFSKYKRGTLDMSKDIERYFHEFMKNGGETGFVQVKDIEKYQKEIENFAKKISRSKLNQYTLHDPAGLGTLLGLYGKLVSSINEGVENHARFATYMTSRQMGRGIVKSVADAKNVSVNFNRKGSGIAALSFKNGRESGFDKLNKFTAGYGATFMRTFIPFYNAAIQGLRNAGYMMKENPIFTSGLGAVMGAMAFGVTGLNQIIADSVDDDNDRKKFGNNPYAQLPEYERRQNICLYLGHGNWIKMPLAIELRSFYGVGDAVAGWTIDPALQTTTVTAPEDGVAKYGAMVMDAITEFSQITPLDMGGSKVFWNDWKGALAGSVTPGAISPIIAVGTNMSWMGTPIWHDTMSNQNAPAWTKASSQTPDKMVEWSRKFSEKTRRGLDTEGAFGKMNNPTAIFYLMQSYLGGPFKDVTETINDLTKEYDAGHTPVAKAFLRSKTPDNTASNARARYYAYKKEATATEDDIKQLKDEAKAGNLESATKLKAMKSDYGNDMLTMPYRRMKVVKKFDKRLTKLYKRKNAAKTKADRDALQQAINESWIDFCNIMDEMEKKRKK